MVIEKKFFPEVKIYAGSPEGHFNLDRNWNVFYSDPITGKRRQRYGNINSFKTYEARLKAAEALRWKVLATIHRGLKIKQILTEHVTNRHYTAKKTKAGHISKVKCFLDWLGRRRLDKEGVEAFFEHVLKTRNGSTYNDYISVLGKLFEEIKIKHFIADVKKVKAYPVPARYFQPHQQRKLAAFMKEYEPELWLHCQFIYYCFIRPQAELLPMKIGDILFEEKKILVRGTNAKNHRQQYVAIPDAFFPHLKPLMSRSPGEFIFPSPSDPTKHRYVNHFRRRHRIMLKGFNFDTKEYQLYSWKHTGAVAAVKAGANLKELQLQLRHHSLDQVDAYLRQLGVHDLVNLRKVMPRIGERRRVDPIAEQIAAIKEKLVLSGKTEKEQLDFLKRVVVAA